MSLRRVRAAAWVVASLMLLAAVPLAAGPQADEEGAMEETPTVSFLMGDMGRTAFTQDTYLMQEFRRVMGGVDLDLILIPRSEMTAKFATLLAGGDLPDIMMKESNGFDIVMEYGPRLFYPVDTQFDRMPNLAKIRTDVPTWDKTMRHADGHIYGFPWTAPYHFFTYGILISPTVREMGVDPRNDLSTMDDLVRVLMQLRDMDPANPPWVTRAGDDLGRTYHVFGTQRSFYLNPDTNRYQFGPADDNYRLMIEVLAGAWAENILHRDFFTMNEEAWREVFAAGNAHFTLDNYSQATSLGTDPTDPSTWLIPILAPAIDGRRYYASYDRGSISPGEGMYMINKDTEHLDRLLDFVDWGYSDEGVTFMFYGREGEVHERMPDGTLRYLIPEGQTLQELVRGLGLRQFTYVFRGNIADQLNPNLAEQSGGNRLAVEFRKDTYDYYVGNDAILPAQPLLSFSQDELDTLKQLRTPLETIAAESSIKFIRGERPLSEWAEFQDELNRAGLEQALAIYQAAYDRFSG